MRFFSVTLDFSYIRDPTFQALQKFHEFQEMLGIFLKKN